MITQVEIEVDGLKLVPKEKPKPEIKIEEEDKSSFSHETTKTYSKGK